MRFGIFSKFSKKVKKKVDFPKFSKNRKRSRIFKGEGRAATATAKAIVRSLGGGRTAAPESSRGGGVPRHNGNE